ncbi:unnamed protein product [Symbiodinium microadriaticum]|nr:unnamed protein product [Symbiodinium microadriaticum]
MRNLVLSEMPSFTEKDSELPTVELVSSQDVQRREKADIEEISRAVKLLDRVFRRSKGKSGQCGVVAELDNQQTPMSWANASHIMPQPHQCALADFINMEAESWLNSVAQRTPL